MTDEQRAQRIHHHMYETCEGIAEHAERIVALEELVADMWFWGYEGHIDSMSPKRQMRHIDGVLDRMRELGIEASDE